ncbi:phage-related baseplate assembly protein [Sedimentibacter acidaminivorans]|uniref:Phage-related baseplate assembly protein n=1 Tax=Sedimentibacter acidaminivorans TaxID=913099 RepID=A0ABS4GB09_9FIRM|nr:baseplate J/gp47 family protein [Sedimentibacter acidaminivorans]MBP1924585.1 phage-related baseplate assembly protein [Sedimentibacter acidaminivorans]
MPITLNDLPEVSFAQIDINTILNDMISGYEQAYYESTGVIKKLYPGDPVRIFLYSQALREFQLRVLIDDAAKQNLLKYSRDSNLDNLAAFSRTYRLQPVAAKVKIKFILSQARPINSLIPVGTRISPGGELYFATNTDTTVMSGTQEIIVDTTCLTKGKIGNDFTPGQINILVDPLPWISAVENTETSQGGADEEDDENYRERIHMAPEGFSVGGPSGAYEYFARQYSSLVNDVKITSPSDGVVDIRILLQDGELPDVSFIDGVKAYLSADERRPLTDKVQVSAPDIVDYDIELTYYISSDNTSQETLIKSKIEQAILDYEIWQRSRTGRDINPSKLITNIQLAGAKRVDIVSPIYTAISSSSVAVLNLKTVTYGGLEDE